jgi:cellobiose-specific phosphotransferase system component IIA
MSEVESVISQAKSMLSESKILAKREKEEKPSIQFKCAHCQNHLFTNLDVTMHEPQQQLLSVCSAKAIKPFKEEPIRANSIASEDETITTMV